METPSWNDGSAPVETSAQSSALESEDEKQLSLFPELEIKNLPKNIGSLRTSPEIIARFVYNLSLGKNATQSLVEAGYGGTEESARRVASRLLSRVDIREARRFYAEKVEAQALITEGEILLDIIENRERAKNPGDGKRPDYRAVNEANRMLGQVKKMFGPESTSNNIIQFSSFEELEALSEALQKSKTEAPAEDKKDDWKETVS